MKFAFLPLFLALASPTFAAPAAKTASKPQILSLEAVLRRAKTNRAQIELLWKQTPQNQRAATLFLLQHAPDADLQSLSTAFLRSQIQIGFTARNTAPWKAQIPESLFWNDVLPYAALNETRDNARARLRALSLPLIAGIKSPGAAAVALNRGLFPLVKVKYSTQREKPDQNPTESMKSGLASCSGLSILLVDACRSVGIPARVAGTPMWADGRGNHTWVEVWDNGWHFLGAAEGDELDRGWFVGDAAQANTGDPENAIYASSWKPYGAAFPLVWNRKIRSVAAQNVTPRYAPTRSKIADVTKTRLLISLLDPQGKRIVAPISVLSSDAKTLGAGQTRGDSADLNDVFAVMVPRAGRVTVSVELDGKTHQIPLRAADLTQQQITLRAVAPGLPPIVFVPLPRVESPDFKPLSPALQLKVEAAARRYFAPAVVSDNPVNHLNADKSLDRLLLDHESAVRAIVWREFKASQANPNTFQNSSSKPKTDFDQNLARNGQHVAPFTLRTVGTKPQNGWGLVIAMHGGGNAPKELNDSQWLHMQTRYRDHPELGGYKYLALRAPNDTWNGFYDLYVYPLIENLIRAQTAFGDVDPGRVFIMGYSHGGYGAYAIGPKIPDRFAFIHASAGAVTDGETLPQTLRNTPFTAMVGEFDTAYGRLERNQKFASAIEKARENGGDFPVRVDIMTGFQHSNLPDRDELVEMLRATRNPTPRHLTWTQTDNVVRDFFYLKSNRPDKNQEIDAQIEANRVTIQTTGEVKGASILLDGRLIDFSKPVQISVNGKISKLSLQPDFNTLCETMARRGDPDLAFAARIPIDVSPPTPNGVK
ncbi:MAG TPA: transglutaminase domain-containing protein [Abditibacterium sp.]|jgi:hypothetical protein